MYNLHVLLCAQGVANRDLKLENLLLDRKDTGSRPLLKICDFGYSKVPNPLTKWAKLTLLVNGPDIACSYLVHFVA